MTSTSTHSTAHDVQIAPELADLNLPERRDGPGAAAMMAAGIGIFVLGLMTTGAAISSELNDFLRKFQGDSGVGPLAGKTTVAVIAWAASWIVLGVAWRGRGVNVQRWFLVALVFGLLGVLFTFPPFFEAFE